MVRLALIFILTINTCVIYGQQNFVGKYKKCVAKTCFEQTVLELKNNKKFVAHYFCDVGGLYQTKGTWRNKGDTVILSTRKQISKTHKVIQEKDTTIIGTDIRITCNDTFMNGALAYASLQLNDSIILNTDIQGRASTNLYPVNKIRLAYVGIKPIEFHVIDGNNKISIKLINAFEAQNSCGQVFFFKEWKFILRDCILTEVMSKEYNPSKFNKLTTYTLEE